MYYIIKKALRISVNKYIRCMNMYGEALLKSYEIV